MSVFHAVVFDFSNMRWEAKLLVLTLLVMVVVAVCTIVIEQIKRNKRARHRQSRWVDNKSTNEDFFAIITRLRNDIDPGYLYPGSPMTMDPYRHLYVDDMTADEAFATVPR